MKSILNFFLFLGSSALIAMQDISFTVEKYDENEALIIAHTQAQEYGSVSFTVGNNQSGISSNIYSLGVKREFRQNGIGSELFIKAIEYCKENNSSVLRWDATFESIHFYKKFNARIINQSSNDLLIGGNALMEFDFSKDGDPRINRYHHSKDKIVPS